MEGGGALFRRRERIREDGVSCQMKALQRGGANLVKWRTLLREGFFKGNVWDIRWVTYHRRLIKGEILE